MTMPSRLTIVLRSVIALVLAIIAIPLVNLAGSELAALMDLPPGGDARLGYDLLWVFLAGLVGSVLMVGIVAVAKTAHAWAIFAIYLGLDIYVTVVAWDAFPRWFSLACLLTLPLQVWLGWWLAWGRRRA
ncbi:hypothetical protein [Pseudoxanthomonas sp. PXM02]|uniref:hypothetical protein n=1 Tax=Pseudoxanthomonas sp. PXM02 TaxID=2769294 RepID=UPI00178046A1|nr:hypothetical protein [Pseudoxanthomonas sp. PXM02]MBD9480442.1 hypothetical protein [Pseudoxanthomonas sp. PXM02]